MPTPQPPRVLVVEDEALVAKDVQATLTRLGYFVPTTLRSGEAALEAVASGPAPDLVLMDIGLAGRIDGVQTAAAIVERCGAPVVFLTAHLDEDTIARAKATNPYGYLIKPFDERELRSTVEVALARHRAESQIRESEARFSSTLRSMADGVIATDLAGTVSYLNPVAEQLTGWPASEAVGRPLADVFQISHPSGEKAEPAPAVPPGDADGEGDPAAGRPTMLATRAGALVPIEDNTAPLTDACGSLAGLVVVFRRRPEQESPTNAGAEASWANLVGIVESIGDPLFAVDASWMLTYVNHRAAAYFGKPKADLIGRSFWDEVPRSIHTRHHSDFYSALLKREAAGFEIHHESRNAYFEVNAYPFGDGLLVLFRDITDRKAAEEQRAKMEKLESLGLLARGFAHDFNNLLTVLLGNISLAAMRLPEDAPARAEVETAKSATLQAQNLVHQLLTFAKGGAPVKMPTRPYELVADVLRNHPRRAGIDYRVEAPTDLPPIRVDPGQVKRLLTNLLRNAEDAMPGGGTLTLTARHVAEPPGPDQGPGHELVLTVTDTGSGIRPDDLEFIFEPYFTTRTDANATGIGLTVCESIARAHDGSVGVASEVDIGTTVTVHLPYDSVAGDVETGDAAAAAPPAPAAGRVLILEDEPLIRGLAVSHLTSRGYQVDATAEGGETVARFREAYEAGRPYDLLVLDLTIPGGLGGARAIEQVLQIDPDVIAVVSSGYSDDPAMAHPEDFGFKGVLPKPYEPKALSDLVAELLAGREQADAPARGTTPGR